MLPILVLCIVRLVAGQGKFYLREKQYTDGS